MQDNPKYAKFYFNTFHVQCMIDGNVEGENETKPKPESHNDSSGGKLNEHLFDEDISEINPLTTSAIKGIWWIFFVLKNCCIFT